MTLQKRPPRGWMHSLIAPIMGTLLAISIPGKIQASPSEPNLYGHPVDEISRPSTMGRGICPEQLPLRIGTIIDAPIFATAQWGVLIESLSSSSVLYSRNPDDFLIPASNIKLLTTAAALQIVAERDPSYFSALAEWIRIVNQDSHNAYADALLSRIGGQQAVRRALTSLGIRAESYAQVDGSGLSRNNRAMPSTFVTLLRRMYISDPSQLFYHSLPVAGANGTLRNRFRGTPAQGIVRAKTGTLNGVRALSGYLEHTDYGLIAFSIVVNQPGQPGATLTQAIDQIVLQTTQLRRCD